MLQSKDITLSSFNDLLDEKERCFGQIIREKDDRIAILIHQLEEERQLNCELQQMLLTKFEKKASEESGILDDEVDSTGSNPESLPMQHGVAAQQSILNPTLGNGNQGSSPMHQSATPEIPIRGAVALNVNERQQTGQPTRPVPVVRQPKGSILVDPLQISIHPNQGQGLYENRSKPRAPRESTKVLEHQSSSIFPKQPHDAPPKVPSRGAANEAKQQNLLCVPPPPAFALERPPKGVNVNQNNIENPNVFQQCQRCEMYFRCSKFQEHQEHPEQCDKNIQLFNSSSIV